ncbi:MAG: integrase [Proteobacteria bacterium]|nr:integrase [Pseudomonadota bacterium]
MHGQSRADYLAAQRERYRKSCRKTKRLILSEVQEFLGIHRKSAIRALRPPKAKIKRGRKVTYPRHLLVHLKALWFPMGQPCGKRMKVMIRLWLPFYVAFEFFEVERILLLKMSAATIDRFLRPVRAQHRRRLNTGTRPPYARMRAIIPIRPLDHNVTEPGHCEADTVAHCGGSMAGLFAWTLTVTDIETQWTEARIMWGKSAKGVVESLSDIEASLPFALKGLYFDNGNEFLNHQLLYYRRDSGREETLILQRGRPYRSNDQCHVEQKNDTHVRQLLGYDRIEVKAAVDLINDLYRNEWSDLQNYFMPQMKLIRKTRVGAKYKRNHSIPMTPFQRIMNSEMIPEETKKKLREKNAQLNPFTLQEQVQKKLRAIYQLIRASENPGGISA